MFVLWYSRSLSEKFLLKCWRKVLLLVTYRECYMQNIFCLGIHFKIWQQWAQVLQAHYVLGSCYYVCTCTNVLVAKEIPTYVGLTRTICLFVFPQSLTLTRIYLYVVHASLSLMPRLQCSAYVRFPAALIATLLWHENFPVVTTSESFRLWN